MICYVILDLLKVKIRIQQNDSIKGQTAIILGFMGLRVSMATIQLSLKHKNSHRQYENN